MSELRIALRHLRLSPGFTVVTTLILALGIGANTAIFTLIDHVMLRSLPVRDPGELAVVSGIFTYPQYQRLRDRNEVFSSLFATHILPAMEVAHTADFTGRARGELVSGNYFDTLGVQPVLGRNLGPEDDRPGASPVVVLSFDYWRRAFGGAADVLGKTLRVRSAAGYANTAGLSIYDGATESAGAVFTVVGVAPPRFFGETVGVSNDIWIPIAMEPAVLPGRPWLDKHNVSWVLLLGRRKSGISREEAAESMSVLWRQLNLEDAADKLTPDRQQVIAHLSIRLEDGGGGFNFVRQQFVRPLQILATATGLVLLIACLNVANLLLARGASRAREMAVRVALGASRWRLVRQSLGESLVLGGLGGVFGLLAAIVGIRILLLMAFADDAGRVHLPIRPDLRMLGITATVSLATTLLFGLVPAFRATQMRLVESLKDARGSANRRRRGMGQGFVVIQIAISLVLLLAAGVFLKSLANLRNQDVGFNPEQLVMMQLDPVSAGYRGDEIGRVCQKILERIAVLPGVRAATFSENGLFYGPESRTKVDVEGFTPESDDALRCHFDQIGPQYFSGLGIPLLLGREISERDGPSAPRVTIINQTMANFYFPGVNPIGRHITPLLEKRVPLEIVGVARDVQDHNLRSKPVRRFYVSFQQPIDGITQANFGIRATANFGDLERMLRREIAQVDAHLMMLNLSKVTGLMDGTLIQECLIARLSSFFGVLAMGLAAVGLYGLMAYDVVQRRNEIGIRMALGASRAAVLGLILRNGLRLTLAGIAVGVVGGAACTRMIESQLHGVQGMDLGTYGLVSLGLVVVALAASWIPARRAASVEPIKALQYE
jgi:predicted permease